MSVSWGTQYAKLKTNLRLASNRLKLLQKKKTEQAQKARIEIAEFLNTNKEDRAESMFCELLLARFGLIQQMKELDDGIAEAVSSILWVAPRISHEIQEFKIINDQLTQKYGKQFAEAARMNQLPEPSRVAPKLIQKLSVSAPSKILVEKYLVEIARCASIDFTPDPKVMRDDDDEIAMAEKNLINFMNEEQIGWSVPKNDGPGAPSSNQGGGYSMPPGSNHPYFPPSNNTGKNNGPGSGGNSLVQYPPPPQYAAPHLHRQPAALVVSIPVAQCIQHKSKMSFVMFRTSFASYNDVKTGYDVPEQDQFGPPSSNNPYGVHTASVQRPPANDGDDHIYEVPPISDGSIPSWWISLAVTNFYRFSIKFPEPPSDFPMTNASHSRGGHNAHSGGGPGKSDELDFDELAKRFDELKKKL
uniref:IST1 homolog n=1 Tax=Ditylenchus dipsaci TaxID=166011 RepID=A0A915DV97_9BILA